MGFDSNSSRSDDNNRNGVGKKERPYSREQILSIAREAVDSKGRTVRYQLLREEQEGHQKCQLTLDDIFEDVSKIKITTY